MNRRSMLLLPALLAASAALAQAAYPARPVTLVVPFAPGGATDVLAREVGLQLAAQLKQPVVIDNKPGAGTTIGTSFVAKAAPDGYTLLFAPTPFSISQVMYPRLPYDAQRDFTPVALLAEAPFILVAHPSVPANSVKELIALAKAKPGTLSFASAGNGTVPHLAGELFKLRTQTDLVHVPYKGGGPAIVDLVAGQTQLMFAVPVEVAQQVAAGRLKVLATTAPERLASYPDVPTLRESGVNGAEVRSWFGLVAPAGVPRPVVDKLAAELARVAESPAIRASFATQGVMIRVKSGEDYARYIAADVAQWREVVKASNARID
ncbi:tripartite tricarboxylate transporter substrate binding protein [Variovorax terrae]|uniref:Tripartite tricarboxylate transporter substrate binding protein n=1 Tax=Variovorax terrae TaxID=2923278 RepID=A0A9X1W3P8_9BURK|nr:tripartite tricarboxylate transporter substrate binding protein [Variovorax terrae]MCJ0765248.1 tripartite tricarboxylate transporter substrate binding protein [Variovorax terrae]